MSKVSGFSRDELEALGSWTDLENFSADPHENSENITPQALTVEQIDAMQQQAYDEAFAEGRKAGFDQGHEEGLQAGRDAGFEKGYAEGLEKGRQDEADSLREKVAEFNRLLEALAEPFAMLDEKIERELVDLSIGIARQLVRREIKVDPGQIVAVVREAVGALPLASQKITLTMHPEDAELVRSALALEDMSPAWKILEDPLLTRGGCLVESGASHVDATVEHRLAAIVAKVLGGERREDRPA